MENLRPAIMRVKAKRRRFETRFLGRSIAPWAHASARCRLRGWPERSSSPRSSRPWWPAAADHSAGARLRLDVAGPDQDSIERDAALRHLAAERAVILTALRRGIRKRCPHCGEGALFSGWAHHLERCAVCGLVYERNP